MRPGSTHFLRLKTVGVIQLPYDDLTLPQRWGSRWFGWAAVDPERMERSDEATCGSWERLGPAFGSLGGVVADPRLCADMSQGHTPLNVYLFVLQCVINAPGML